MKCIIDRSILGFVSFLGTVLVVTSHEAHNPLTGQNNQPVHHHSGSRQPSNPHPQAHPHPQAQPNQQTQGHQGGHALPTIDRNVVQDQEHIMEHLDGKIQRPEETMSEEELQFHYFKVHDYDDNNMLDGIELITALTHHHEAKPKAEGGQPAEPEEPRMSDDELSSTIDAILDSNDFDRDGFIDYAEFVRNQRIGATNSEV